MGNCSITPIKNVITRSNILHFSFTINAMVTRTKAHENNDNY